MPALAGVAGAGMGAMLVGQLAASILEKNPVVKAAAKSMSTQVTSTLQATVKPLVPIVVGAMSQISGFLKQIGPQLAGVFKTLGPVIMPVVKDIEGVFSQLIPLMRAAVPAILPFVNAITGLVRGILPGLVTIVKAVVPYLGQLASTISGVGRDLGKMLSAMAPAIGPSMQILTMLVKLVGSLMPIIGQLAATLATNLAPVLVAIMGAFKALEPAIKIVFGILAQLAGAVLASISGVLQTLARLFVALSPAVTVLAKSLGQVFTVLENSGVMFVLANAVGQIAPLIAKLVNTLVIGLAPVLPKIIGLFAQFLAVLTGQATAVLTAILKIFIALAPAIVTVVTWITKLLSSALQPMLPVLAGAVIAWKLLTIAMNTNPFVAIATAALLLAAVIVKYHTQIWAFIVKTWNEVKNFVVRIWNDILSFAKQWWPLLLGPAGLIVKYHNDIWAFIVKTWNNILNFFKSIWNVIFGFFKSTLSNVEKLFSDGWNSVFSTVKNVWNAIKGWLASFWNAEISGFRNIISTVTGVFSRGWNDIYNGVKGTWNNIKNFISSTLGAIKGGFDSSVNTLKTTWNKLEGIFKGPVNFLIKTVYDGGIVRFWNDVMGAIGGPKLKSVPGLAGGGRITRGTGPISDDVLARVSKDETVVSAAHSKILAPFFSAVGVPGYASGGIPNPISAIVNAGKSAFNWAKDAVSIGSALLTGNTTALGNDLMKLIGSPAAADLAKMMIGIPKTIVGQAMKFVKSLIAGGQLGGGAGEIVKYAESWIGKIPYVWGGTAVPGGADCSGFTQAVYSRFGIHAPRTSEAQGSWVRRSGPQPGGLAFYHSMGGGPDPGHVAIVKDMNTVISQGGGMGPILMGIRGMPLLWTGVPPGGFPKGAGGAAPGGTVGSWIAQSLGISGKPSSWAHDMGVLVSKESRGDSRAQNPSGASGIAQMMPATFRAYMMAGHGNIWSPVDNLISSERYIAASYGSPDRIPGLVSGGTYVGYGTGGIGGGWATVGEYGRELVRLPQGSHVYPHTQPHAAGPAFGAVGSGVLKVELGVDSSAGVMRDLISLIKEHIRVNGGLAKVLGP